VAGEEEEAERLAVHLGKRVPETHDVPQALGHLRVLELEEAGVHPDPREGAW
jgi:hypothetical protein